MPLPLLQTIGEDLFAIALVRHALHWALGCAMPRRLPCPHPPRCCLAPY